MNGGGTASGETLFYDDFKQGVRTSGSSAAWYLRPVESFPQGDGVLSVTEDEGLVVVPSGTHPETGDPMFAQPEGVDGPTEFLRWAAFTTAKASTGVLGFDAAPGTVLRGGVEMSSRMLGVAHHTFGDAVTDPDREMKLGAAALICIDMATGMVFDLVLTNAAVFALYERLPRPGLDHKTFSYSVKVADRKPDQLHLLEVAFDASRGVVRWRVDGADVLEVGDLGQLSLDRKYLLREAGGDEQDALPAQLNFGVSVFAAGLWGQGVRLAVRSVRVNAAEA